VAAAPSSNASFCAEIVGTLVYSVRSATKSSNRLSTYAKADSRSPGFMTVGMAALLVLIPLAATSTAGMVRRLGGTAWRRLHRLAYLAGLLAALHFLWLAKVGRDEPYVYAGWLALVLGARLWDAGRRLVRRRGGRQAAAPRLTASPAAPIVVSDQVFSRPPGDE